MKIYAITSGDYSEYHICAVADNMKRAKELQKFFGADNIETFDTETYTSIFERGYKEYSCRMNEDGMIDIGEKYTHDFPDVKVVRYGTRNSEYFHLDVIAKDKEHAQKIFTDKVAEYKARYHLL